MQGSLTELRDIVAPVNYHQNVDTTRPALKRKRRSAAAKSNKPRARQTTLEEHVDPAISDTIASRSEQIAKLVDESAGHAIQLTANRIETPMHSQTHQTTPTANAEPPHPALVFGAELLSTPESSPQSATVPKADRSYHSPQPTTSSNDFRSQRSWTGGKSNGLNSLLTNATAGLASRDLNQLQRWHHKLDTAAQAVAPLRSVSSSLAARMRTPSRSFHGSQEPSRPPVWSSANFKPPNYDAHHHLAPEHLRPPPRANLDRRFEWASQHSSEHPDLQSVPPNHVPMLTNSAQFSSPWALDAHRNGSIDYLRGVDAANTHAHWVAPRAHVPGPQYVHQVAAHTEWSHPLQSRLEQVPTVRLRQSRPASPFHQHW